MKMGSLQAAKLYRPSSGGSPYLSQRTKTAPAPVPTDAPGMFGGPPGSFITTSSCPAGYNTVPMSNIGLSRGEKRCVPKPYVPPAPIIAPPPPAPVITVSPVMQQQFTPQFSPTMQQQQDSPGAAQSAAPVQVAETAQVARPAPPQVIPALAPAPVAAPPVPVSMPMHPDQSGALPMALPGIPNIIGAPSIMDSRGIDVTSPVAVTAAKKGIDNLLIPLLIGGGALLILMTTKPKKVKK